jgi:hypothetical protein
LIRVTNGSVANLVNPSITSLHRFGDRIQSIGAKALACGDDLVRNGWIVDRLSNVSAI